MNTCETLLSWWKGTSFINYCELWGWNNYFIIIFQVNFKGSVKKNPEIPHKFKCFHTISTHKTLPLHPVSDLYSHTRNVHGFHLFSRFIYPSFLQSTIPLVPWTVLLYIFLTNPSLAICSTWPYHLEDFHPCTFLMISSYVSSYLHSLTILIPNVLHKLSLLNFVASNQELA